MYTKTTSRPDRPTPGLKRAASSVDHQGGDSATGEPPPKRLRGREYTSIPTWNVRTLSQTGKLKELTHELETYAWHVVGLCGTGGKNSGEQLTEEARRLHIANSTRQMNNSLIFETFKHTGRTFGTTYSGLRNSQKELHQYKDSAREFTKFNLNKTAEEDRHPSNTTDEGEDTAVSDVLDKVDWERLEKEQSRRLATLKAYCASQPETRVRFRVVPGTCLNMRPDVVPLGKALYKNFLTPPRCEWVPNFDKKHVGINARRLRMLMDYSKEQAGLRLSAFKKIIVVRDPLESM
ncbi:hypothetical protein Bbelb_302060 [Branchiostoma belcheri]|nr:hypothetical protein Bbelb_302060 [Branchiostoma belcheri]